MLILIPLFVALWYVIAAVASVREYARSAR